MLAGTSVAADFRASAESVTISNNTVIAQGEGIAIRNREPTVWPLKVFSSAEFSGSPVSGGHATGHLLRDYDEAARLLRAPYEAALEMDPSPIHVMRYRDIQVWPTLPSEPSGLDGNPLVPGDIGAVTSVSAGKMRLPGVHP